MFNDPVLQVFIPIFLFVVGAAMGSFAGATVYRLKHKKDIVKDRSECEHCHHKLAASDLIPVFSWLWLRGRCRYCGKNIGVGTLAYELAVGAYFVLSYLLWPFPLIEWYQITDFVIWLAYGVGVTILFAYDLKWYLLPDKVVFPLIALGAVDAIIRLATTPGMTFFNALFELAAGVAAIAGFYWLLYTFSKGKWVGFGDVKLGIFLGLALGWQLALVCLFAANLLGTLLVLPGLLTGKLKRTTRIPFGPLLIAGFVIAGLFGEYILNWYFGLLLTPTF
jgi:prepilin signal peptidase PulO-like enzyme (type II secretory pathway)